MSADGIKLFVYGVSASCPRGILEKEFGKCGRVNDIFNTGKGYAFITMADERDAKIAVEDLNGQTVDGQEIKVEISHGKGSDKPGRRDDRGGRDRRDGRRGGGGGRMDRGRDGGRDRYGGGGGRDFGRRGGYDDRDRGRDRGHRDDRREDRDRSRDRSYNRRDDY